MPVITPGLPLPIPGRVLVVVAHPDDAEFQCGGTLARWSAGGCKVSHLICTDGSKGTWDPTADTAALVAVRREEQRAAAQALGATGTVVFLDRVDGELDADLATRSDVARVIRELRPDVVFGHDPWKRYRLHPDHRHAGWLTVDGIVAARDPHFFPEHGIAHHRPSALLLFEADEPDHAEDVTGFEDRKIAALEAHTSQFETTMHISADDPGPERERFRRRILAELQAGAKGLDVDYAERFKLITDL
jgi:LmbE family N-acetylglucosaminyl deacetylase